VWGCFYYKNKTSGKEKTKTQLKTSINIPREKIKKKIVKKETEKPVKTEKTEKTEKSRLKLIIDLNISKPKSEKQQPKTPQHNVKENKGEIKTLQNNVSLLQTRTLPSYATCIALSERYYNEGDYENALNWAKNANLQNNKKPESWIMSAKALVKLGKKQEAVKILKIYYNYHKDERIKKLLGELDERDK
jgi:predicted Zn-dependent protease